MDYLMDGYNGLEPYIWVYASLKAASEKMHEILKQKYAPT